MQAHSAGEKNEGEGSPIVGSTIESDVQVTDLLNQLRSLLDRSLSNDNKMSRQ